MIAILPPLALLVAPLRAQGAAARAGVRGWILWNPQNHYTWSAIPTPEPAEETSHAKTR